jgi:predicted amino acid-binding ACT domain protein
MLVLDIPRKSPSHFSHIDVPLYHRVHLALAEGVPVHACLLAGLNSPHLPELVISPFDFGRWDKLWRLSVSLRDRAGLLHDVAASLRMHKANILAAESGMMEEQNIYHIEMIIDIEDEESIERIEWSIQTKLFNESIILAPGNSRLRIRRLQNLWLAKKAYERQHRMPVGFTPVANELNLSLERQHQKSPLKKFRFILPPRFRAILRSEISQHVGDRDDEGYYLRLSDTKDRFLRVLFFKATDPVIHARLEYDDRLGAAADVTEALSEKGFNILAAYLGPSEGSNRCRCEVVVRCERLSGRETNELKERFETALSTSPLVQDLQMAVGYPRNYANQWDRRNLTPTLVAQPEGKAEAVNEIGTLKKKLDSHYEVLHSKLDTGVIPEGIEVQRWWFVNKLRKQYRKLWPFEEISSGKSLFVSCHYHGNQLEIIKRQAAKKGFLVLTGEDLLKDPNITIGLLARIKSCTHFLGVWSTEGAQLCGERYWPSSWLLWEFGVAEAFGLRWRLLIAKGISELAWRGIVPHVATPVFDHDFETKLENVLGVLSELEAERLPWQDFSDLQRPFLSKAG